MQGQLLSIILRIPGDKSMQKPYSTGVGGEKNALFYKNTI
jgi:hypothetical protein